METLLKFHHSISFKKAVSLTPACAGDDTLFEEEGGGRGERIFFLGFKNLRCKENPPLYFHHSAAPRSPKQAYFSSSNIHWFGHEFSSNDSFSKTRIFPVRNLPPLPLHPIPARTKAAARSPQQAPLLLIDVLFVCLRVFFPNMWFSLKKKYIAW